MANSGQAGEAVEYYHRALEFNPGYIRARSITIFIFLAIPLIPDRFNLGISYINLRVRWFCV